MEKIASFKVNHLFLRTGLYVSRRDENGGVCVTTYDMRVCEPNREPVMDMPAIHTIEHLGATYLRNSEISRDVVYFGPMGCRTGFYILLFGEKSAEEISPLILKMCDFILDYTGDIPGAKPDECGNFSEQNLNMAKFYIAEYKRRLITFKNFTYPEGGESD